VDKILRGAKPGGAAHGIAPHLGSPVEVVDNLVLEGVLVLALLPRAAANG